MSRFRFDETAFIAGCEALATAGSAALVGGAISGVNRAASTITAARVRAAVARRIKAERLRARELDLALRAARTDAMIQAYHRAKAEGRLPARR
jgi:hypothetical protein